MNLSARNALVLRYLPLVHKIAIAKWLKGGPLRLPGSVDDLVQIGALGLLHAADHWQPRHGSRATFCTYAYACIGRHIESVTRRQTLLKVPTRFAFRQAPARLQRLVDRARSVGAFPHDAAGRAYEPAYVEPERWPYLDLAEALAKLRKCELELISQRYGLNGSAPRTLSELAAARGVTRQAVKSREQKILARLRKLLGGDDDSHSITKTRNREKAKHGQLQ